MQELTLSFTGSNYHVNCLDFSLCSFSQCKKRNYRGDLKHWVAAKSITEFENLQSFCFFSPASINLGIKEIGICWAPLECHMLEGCVCLAQWNGGLAHSRNGIYYSMMARIPGNCLNPWLILRRWSQNTFLDFIICILMFKSEYSLLQNK